MMTGGVAWRADMIKCFLILLAVDISMTRTLAKGSARLIPINLESSQEARANLSGGQTGA